MKRPSQRTVLKATAAVVGLGLPAAATPVSGGPEVGSGQRPGSTELSPNWGPRISTLGKLGLPGNPEVFPGDDHSPNFAFLRCMGNDEVGMGSTLYPGDAETTGTTKRFVQEADDPTLWIPIPADGIKTSVDDEGQLTVTPMYGEAVTTNADGADVTMATTGPDGKPTGDSYEVKVEATDSTLGQNAHQYTVTLMCGAFTLVAAGAGANNT